MSSWLVPGDVEFVESVGVADGVDGDTGGVMVDEPLFMGMDIMPLSLLPSDVAYLLSAS